MSVIFFDLDGTILDISLRYYVIYLMECRRLGIRPLEIHKYWQMKRNKIPEIEILRLSSNKSLTSTEVEDVIKWRQTNIESPTFLHFDTLYPGAIPVLQDLRRSFRLEVMTKRSVKESTLAELQRFGTLEFFDHVHLSEGSKSAALNANENCAKDAALVIGDTEEDYQLAEYLSVPFLFASYGIRSPRSRVIQEMNSLWSLNSIADLTPALVHKIIYDLNQNRKPHRVNYDVLKS